MAFIVVAESNNIVILGAFENKREELLGPGLTLICIKGGTPCPGRTKDSEKFIIFHD